MEKSTIIVIAIIIISFVLGIYLYPQMPDMMVSHWGAAGEPNGSMSKPWALFFMPVLSIILFVLFLVIPKMDPKWKNIEGFKDHYDRFIVIMMLFLFFIHCLTLAWNLDYRFNMILFLLPAFSVLFYCVGILISHAKMNYSIGIRTPWTLSNKTVWEKTHKLGGILFKAVAVTILLGLLLQKYAFYLMIAEIMGVSLFIVVYSYVEYRRTVKNR